MSETQTLDRQEFKEMLEDWQDLAFSSGDRLTAFRIRRVLRRPRALNQLFEKTMQAAHDQRSRDGLQADGEFLKWFFEWFSNGGAQVILEFIKQLIPLFSK